MVVEAALSVVWPVKAKPLKIMVELTHQALSLPTALEIRRFFTGYQKLADDTFGRSISVNVDNHF
jgi:hypothetical protein